MAYDECQKMGATLAVIDTQYKVKELLWHLTYWFRRWDLMYVGLIHDVWIPVEKKISEYNVMDCKMYCLCLLFGLWHTQSM